MPAYRLGILIKELMKIRNNILLTSLIVFFISSTSLSQTETSKTKYDKLYFTQKFFGGQIEACTIGFGYGFGGLVDIDMLTNKKSKEFSVGIRISVEHFVSGFETTKSLLDYNVYARPSVRFKRFWISLLGGAAYHTSKQDPSEIVLKGGFELKYNVLDKYIGVMLKLSTTFTEKSNYGGIGISLGYFN